MTNHPSFHTFSGAVGFLQGLENQRIAEEQQRKEERARQRELDNIYNAGVDEYNGLVKEYNALNHKYKKSLRNADEYREIALELAKYLRSAQEEKHELQSQVESLQQALDEKNNQLHNAQAKLTHLHNAHKKLLGSGEQLQKAYHAERAKNQALLRENTELKNINIQQQNISKNQDLKLSQIKSGFQKVSSQANSEQLYIKFIFTKFKVLNNIVEHLVNQGQLSKENLAQVEKVLISQWDDEDNKKNSVTASEAGAFVAAQNPELFNKLKISF